MDPTVELILTVVAISMPALIIAGTALFLWRFPGDPL